MRVIEATEPMTIAHPVTMLFCPPGVGKTSLAFTAKRPLCLDFDLGAHRSGNRKRTAQPESWAEVLKMLDDRRVGDWSLDEFDTIIPDTVGRLLDMMSVYIIEESPKRGAGGQLDQKGWGILRDRFHTFISRLRALDKDVVMLAHAREKDDGDAMIMRPDIQGGSYGEVMKSADLVGYLYVQGKDRILDFSPTDRWVGKNPAGWAPMRVPDFSKQPEFLAGLLDKAREALGKISQESATAAVAQADWRAAIETYTTAEELTAALPKVEALAPIMAAPVKKLLWERSKALGMTYDAPKREFVPVPKPVATKEPAVA